ncbi:hypothetical protein [Gluconobacter oxydans]|uniref:Uncharacterized protein n=1 Tax=Gluconobacter oxydans NBRC 3293 TaxID=1315969 RepID=A0A829WXY0_GLUOY|nr:hypothetical protein [Gluconobacter oxydans]GEM17983.1 hypothetical protein NBRC3293_2480 [Gluconobacter oxydans NBRC 3293]
MSETIEAPGQTAPEAPETNILSGIQFGSDEQGSTPEDGTVTPPADANAPGAEAPQQPETKKPETPEWLQRKIDRATYERREAERQAQAAREELEQTRRALAAARGEQQEEPQLTPDQIRQQERQRFEQQQAEQQSVQQFASQTEVIAKSLAGAHGEEAVGQATKLLSDRAGLDFGNKSHRQIIADISELPNSGAVYYALSQDPDAASALLDAPERRQYAMLQKFAASVNEAPAEQARPSQPAPRPAASQISKAPAPVPAATGSARPSGGSQSLYDDNLSAEAFAKMFSKRG